MKPEMNFVTDFRGKFIAGGKPSYHTSDTSEPHLRFYGFYWPLWLMWVRKSLKHPLRVLCLCLLRTVNFVAWRFVVRAPSRKVSWHHWSSFTGHPSSTDIALPWAQESWFGGGLLWTGYMAQGLKQLWHLEPCPGTVLAYFSHRKNQELWGNKTGINPNIEYVKRVESKEGFIMYRF